LSRILEGLVKDATARAKEGAQAGGGARLDERGGD
jgi:hypothetical protein